MAKNGFDELMSIGVDIGKDVFHLVGFNTGGQLVLRKKIKRTALIVTFEELPRCILRSFDLTRLCYAGDD